MSAKPISTRNKVSKVLRILSQSCETKVDDIVEAKDLKVLTMDEFIGNHKTHEKNRSQDFSKKEAKKDKLLVLKFTSRDMYYEEEDMDYLTKIFKKTVKKNGEFRKEFNSPREETFSDSVKKVGRLGI